MRPGTSGAGRALEEGSERFGDEVLYLPNATYPVHIRGLGGRSIEYARELRDQLGQLLDRVEEEANA